MDIDIDEIKDMIDKVIDEFNNKEEYLIKNRLSERCICSKFATYIHNEIRSRQNFEKYDVDMEYDRGFASIDSNKKQIDDHDVYLDLIVHERGCDQMGNYNNLICMEMKYSATGAEYEKDLQRLELLTRYDKNFWYKIGYMIKIDSDKQKLLIEKIFVDDRI